METPKAERTEAPNDKTDKTTTKTVPIGEPVTEKTISKTPPINEPVTERKVSKKQLMDEYGIVKTTTWQGWCTATGLQNKDSYSEQEIAQFNQILNILRNAEKFNEKPTILIPNLPTYLGSIVIALVIGAIAGFFFGVIFTVTVKSTRTSYLLDKPVQLYVAQQIKRN